MKRILIIAGGVIALVALVVTMWLTSPEGQLATPKPGGGEVTLPTGPGISYDPNGPDGSTVPQPGENEGDEHGEDEGSLECGENGPVTQSCEDDGPVAPIPSAEVLETGKAAVRTFALEWVTVDSSETKAERAARLKTVGASDAVASQVSLLTRPDSNHTSLVSDVVPDDPMYVSFNRVMNNGNEYLVSTNVIATYSIAAGTQSTTWNFAGSIFVRFDPATGKIVSVDEHFKTLATMR